MPYRCRKKTTLALVALTLASRAWAEGPMATDDAGTLDKGGMKVEGVWAKDDQTQGGELLFGFSPVAHLELEVAAARAEDDSANPATRLRGVGLGAKWVPFQNDIGWSLGARFDFGRTRVDDREAEANYVGREYAVTGLASWRRENGQVLHLNLGAEQVKAQGERDTVGTWSIGYEVPLIEKMQLTLETYGAEQSRPDKAIGLRYEVVDGFKVSGALGQGNDRDFGQVGAAWEF